MAPRSRRLQLVGAPRSGGTTQFATHFRVEGSLRRRGPATISGMPAYIGGPAWPELDDALARRDLPAALRAGRARHRGRRRRTAAGHRHLSGDVPPVRTGRRGAAWTACTTFGAQRPAEPRSPPSSWAACTTSCTTARPSRTGGSPAPARLVAGQPDCIEHALAACRCQAATSSTSPQLQQNADTVARAGPARSVTRTSKPRHSPIWGPRRSPAPFVDEGMTLLDEAMAMVLSGEASSPFAAIEVVCNLLSSCARVGDLARADQWTRAADRHLGLGIDAGPAFLYAHCRSNLGLDPLRRGPLGRSRGHAAPGRRAGPRRRARASEGQVRAALAELWVLQGRLDDAERLLAGAPRSPGHHPAAGGAASRPAGVARRGWPSPDTASG